MNLIKVACASSTTISHILVDARVGNRKDMALGSRSMLRLIMGAFF